MKQKHRKSRFESFQGILTKLALFHQWGRENSD